MTQDEIIEMARQAWADAGEGWVAKEWFDDRAKAFEAFAKLVAAKAIAELESQKPVAWRLESGKAVWLWFERTDPEANSALPNDVTAIPLYAHPPQRTEQNFCSRCGKRTNDIHTCTPPQRSESSGKPSAWVGLTDEEIEDIVEDCDGVGWDVAQAIEAKLKEKNS